MNQIINMIMRILMRKAINSGINAGLNAASGIGKKRSQGQMPVQSQSRPAALADFDDDDGDMPVALQPDPAEEARRKAARQAARQARRAARDGGQGR